MTKNKDCLYCTKDERLDALMLEVCPLSVSTLFLLKDQTHKGRVIVAYKDHVKELFDLEEKELELFAKDISRAAKAISKIFLPDKINYGAYGDTLYHMHFHIVPKYKNGVSFGGTFDMSREDKVILKDNEYFDLIELIKKNI
ncbi:MAG TPA: HIT family protein [Clostridium sp.]